jgi:hypothetical protein
LIPLPTPFHSIACADFLVPPGICDSTEDKQIQGGVKWDPFSMILLRLFFAVLPVICVAILQNFYVQSAVFASQTASGREFQDRHVSGENATEHQLWQQRLVSVKLE